MRVDGKWMVGSDIPDGQATLTELLEECFELTYNLRTDTETEKEEENNNEDAPQADATA